MHILHVEDDPAQAAAVRAMLEGVADNCEWTTYGERAVEMAERKPYNVILLDLGLPDIDGYEVLMRLRSGGVRTPCLVLPDRVDRRTVLLVESFGAADHLVKPFAKEALVGRIDAVIARSGLSDGGRGPRVARQPAASRTDGAERRRHERTVTSNPATILHGGGIACTVVNMSHGAVGLELSEDVKHLPDPFVVEFEDGARHVCSVRWRNGVRLGVTMSGDG